MALFVQIDHFRKTDQKPTVKNHLFSISWFRSFNRTSFQQQLKQVCAGYVSVMLLQSYILSTTTETFSQSFKNRLLSGFNRTSFQQQLKPKSAMSRKYPALLQSYILSTTTETDVLVSQTALLMKLQSYILSTTTETILHVASV